MCALNLKTWRVRYHVELILLFMVMVFFSHLQKMTQGLNTRATSMAIFILNRLISHDEQGF